MNSKLLHIIIILTAVAFISCTRQGCIDPSAINYDEKAEENDGSCIYPLAGQYETPDTYQFLRNGESSVSYSGQTARMDMLSEMVTILKSANTPGVSIDAQVLKNMYANVNTPFSNGDLNSSGKDLKSKTAGGDPTIQLTFEAYMDSIASLSNKTTTGNYNGSNGSAGVVQSGNKAYLFDANGVELTQLIEKGLMAAVFYHQITNVYLAEEKMDVDNTDLEEGKNYTTMEHHWDEAFGYFTDATDFPVNGTDRYWGKYANARDEELNCNETLMNAFILGRTAITHNDLETRDAQIEIIRTELEKVVIATAIDYLEGTKANLADDAIRNHELSEAYAFIDAIRYGHTPVFTNTEVNNLLNLLGDNYYEVTIANLDEAINTLSAKL